MSKLIKLIRQEGGFVRNIAGEWFDVGDRNAREKIGQAFRDSLHTKYKSSTKAKASIRRQRTSSSSNGSISSFSETDNSFITAMPRHAPSFPMREVTLDNIHGHVTPDVVKEQKKIEGVEVIEPLPVLETLSYSYGAEKHKCINSVEAFEPLPLTQALTRHHSHSMSLVIKDNESFEEAMDEMFLCHFSDSSEDAIAFAFSSLGSLPSTIG